MTEYYQSIHEAVCSAIPESGLTVSEWAGVYRMLAPERAARPGLWDNDVVPYARAIMDAASDPAVSEIVFMKSAQVAGSEIANNIIGFYMHISPSPILYVCETEGKARAWSQESLATMIRDTPVLSNIVEDARGRDEGNTINAKKFPGGHLAVSWATSAATLSSRPRRIVIFDEVDAFGSTTEGDPIGLGEARTKTFPDRKIIKISTPRKKPSRIQKDYENTWRGKYWVPCPGCGTMQVLEWARIQWDKAAPLDAYYACIEGCVIEHDDKQEMLAKGEWRFEGDFNGSVGFYIWEAYSPFVTWGEMVVNFLKKKGTRDQLMEFVNTSLAQVWDEEEQGGKIELGSLPERLEDYGAEIPAGVLVLTAGADIQVDRIEYEIVGWGFDQESWSIARGVIWGDPTTAAPWEKLRLVLMKSFTDAEGREFRVLRVAIDSGDGNRTQQVYDFCRRNQGRGWFAIKGSSTPARPLISPPSRVGTPAIPLFIVGTEAAKDTFSANLATSEPGPGYCHFPDTRAEDTGQPIYDEGFFTQLVAEKPVEKFVRGVKRRVWVKIRQNVRNEALDARIYAMAALAILRPNLAKIAERMLAQPTEKPTDQPDVESDRRGKRPKRPSFLNNQRKPGGFVRNWR